MIKWNRYSFFRPWVCLALAILVPTASSLAAAPQGVDPESAKILKKATDYLASLEQFALVTDSTIEVVLETGQKIQFDNATAITVKRPNQLHAVRLGDLVDQEFFYDGKSLTLHDIDAGFYATVEAPETLEGMLDFARDSLDIVAPAGDFVYSNAYEILMDGVDSGMQVGASAIRGVLCDHLAFSKPGTDFQVWIAQGTQPLPMKLVITSRDVLNAPQFTVQIREWDLKPQAASDKFVFVKPDGARPIPFIILESTEN
jgi:hypothetical protein